MNTRLLLLALVPLFVLSACKKETTIQETVTVNEVYNPAPPAYLGTWKKINEDPTDTSKTYFIFMANSSYCLTLEQSEDGFKRKDYSTISGNANSLRFDDQGFRPYKVSGDTMTVYDDSRPGDIDELLVKVTNGSVDAANWLKTLSVSRTVTVPSYHQNNVSTSASFGIDGDFLYISAWNSIWRIYKFNTLNGTHVDSGTAAGNTINAIHFRGSSNKLYHTRYSGTYAMLQRVGLNGANSNLSTNTISSVRSISTNATSGTVYAFRSNTLYSGSEGGNFSSLFTFTGSYPRGNVYYKSDQFLGVYNGTLVLFEISPTFKIIQQYELPGGSYIYQSIATNGSDIWVMFYNNNTNQYGYKKVSLN